MRKLLKSAKNKVFIKYLFFLLGCDAKNTAEKPFFPTAVQRSQTEIKREFGIVYDTTNPDSALHYNVATPLSWVQVELPAKAVTPQHPVQEQCWLKSNKDPDTEIKVTLVYTPHEVSPDDWLKIRLKKLDEKILEQNVHKQEGGEQPDFLTISNGFPQRISRWTVLKDWAKATGGAHLFVLRASTPAENYTEELANQFFMAVSSFDLLHPTNWPYAEQLRTLVRNVPMQVATAFPISWEQHENPASDEHFYQVKLTKTLNGHRIGFISFMVLAEQSSADIERLERENAAVLAQEGLMFGAAKFASAPSFGGLTHVARAVQRQTNAGAGPAQERHALRGRAGRYWVLAESIHFTQEAAPDEWAICKRAFDIVQQHLAINP